ncbi:MAG: membrane lipoprotein lipid attachment site-containing protein [Anaerolineae bacterium]|nr:membrane lipoprotein lipid attachment site-containing protein [Anaerolineae bacterium]
MKRILVVFTAMLLLAGCGFPRTAANTPELPYASLTPFIATSQSNPVADAQIESLNAGLHSLETQVAALSTQLADKDQQLAGLQAEFTRVTILLTPTVTPTYQIPPTPLITPTSEYVMAVVALRKLNLRKIDKYNQAGNPIMVIAEPRVQYFEGDIFYVRISPIMADGGSRYYEVVGPRGAGLYVRAEDFKLLEG